jgi:hypothetical protein
MNLPSASYKPDLNFKKQNETEFQRKEHADRTTKPAFLIQDGEDQLRRKWLDGTNTNVGSRVVMWEVRASGLMSSCRAGWSSVWSSVDGHCLLRISLERPVKWRKDHNRSYLDESFDNNVLH